MEAAAGIEEQVQLLVEGNDQRNFFEAFSKHLELPGIQIHDFGGVSQLRGFLAALVNARRFDTVRSLGIIRDAETNARSAFQSVQSSLENARLPTPRSPGERVGANPAVSVLILPPRGQAGMLETLLCSTFEGSPVDDCINAFFDCVDALPDSVDRSDKARAQAYLATKPDPHLSVGVAAKRGYWNLGDGVFQPVRDFLRRL